MDKVNKIATFTLEQVRTSVNELLGIEVLNIFPFSFIDKLFEFEVVDGRFAKWASKVPVVSPLC